ncbi:MAG: hypothetical protein KTR14_06720 [Vampirovibrio sp.]|nr:hypothetical protein [Vampirovibrio sp.]
MSQFSVAPQHQNAKSNHTASQSNNTCYCCPGSAGCASGMQTLNKPNQTPAADQLIRVR